MARPGRAVALVGGEVGTPEGGAELWKRIRQELVDVQFGRADDAFGWMTKLV